LFQVTLEHAFDRFLAGIEDLGVGLSSKPESSDRWIPWLVLTAAAGLGAGAGVRRWRWRGDGNEEPGELGSGSKLGRHGLPGLPSAR
jgi:hypothetical protein